MRKLLTKRKRRGSTTIIAVAVTFAILIFFWMFMELQQFFDAQYNVEVRCQRAVNASRGRRSPGGHPAERCLQ